MATAKGGVNGRSVPGAVFVEKASAVSSRKRKKNKAKSHEEDVTSSEVKIEEIPSPVAATRPTPENPAPTTIPALEAAVPAPAASVIKPEAQQSFGNTAKEISSTDESDNSWTEIKTKAKAKSDESESYHTADETDGGWWPGGDGGLPSLPDDGPEPFPKSAGHERTRARDALKGQASPTFKKLPESIRNKIGDFIGKRRSDLRDAEWKARVRLTIWRAVIRANYWWVNPETGLHTGKPKTVDTPDGAYLDNFELFVTCCAKRADRVGKDLPEPEYVQKVEGEVRKLLSKAEKDNMHEQLDHLAFLLMFDEEHDHTSKRVLSLEDMQERIAWAFEDVEFDWSRNEVIKALPQEKWAEAETKSTCEIAEGFWRESVLQS